jgi:hypothetical protein
LKYLILSIVLQLGCRLSLAEEFKFHVQPLDPNFKASSMSGEKSVIHSLPQNKKNEQEIKGNKLLPSNKEVLEVFKSASLDQEASKMDAFERDRLYLRAKKIKFNELSKLYPEIDQEKLQRFSRSLLNVVKEQ